LQLLVHQTEAFANDPLNVLAKEKHFVVKNFHRTLVNQARSTFNDAKIQSERWLQGVVLPLEIQMKDHKAQLQSRLDSLAKINEKTTSINEQMAMLRAAEQDLKRQREMIDGLITRVAEYGAHPVLSETPPIHRPEQDVPVDFMQTARVPVFKPTPAAGPEGADRGCRPRAGGAPNHRRPSSMTTSSRSSTRRKRPSPRLRWTTRSGCTLPSTRNASPTPSARSRSRRSIPTTAPTTPEDSRRGQPRLAFPGAETTQRLDLSIQRLQEAKRLLQKQ
jgi:hypothetical protein